jgi:hypothetical protein
MGSVWAKKPAHDEVIWQGFNGIHNFAIFMSVINIFIRVSSFDTGRRRGLSIHDV